MRPSITFVLAMCVLCMPAFGQTVFLEAQAGANVDLTDPLNPSVVAGNQIVVEVLLDGRETTAPRVTAIDIELHIIDSAPPNSGSMTCASYVVDVARPDLAVKNCSICGASCGNEVNPIAAGLLDFGPRQDVDFLAYIATIAIDTSLDAYGDWELTYGTSTKNVIISGVGGPIIDIVNNPGAFRTLTITVLPPPCADDDGDGFGANGSVLCPNGTDLDCDDSDPGIYPGAPEITADGIDQDCDGKDPLHSCEDLVSAQFGLGQEIGDYGERLAIDGDLAMVAAPLANYGGNSTAGAVYAYRLNSGSGSQQWEILETLRDVNPPLINVNGPVSNRFGTDVAMDGDLALISAADYDDSGSVVVLRFTGNAWVAYDRLFAPDADPGDRFGYSVAIDGNLAIVGAPWNNDRIGTAYLYRNINGKWTLEAVLHAEDGNSGDRFGLPVAITRDSTGSPIVVVSAPDEDGANPSDSDCDSGATYVFRQEDCEWTQVAKLVGSGTECGDYTHKMAAYGDRIALGAQSHDAPVEDEGVVFVFRLFGDDWIEEAVLQPADSARLDRFGYGIDIGADVIVAGATGVNGRDGAVYSFRFDGVRWVEGTTVHCPTQLVGTTAVFGNAVAIDGGRTLTGMVRGEGSQFFRSLVDCNANGTTDGCEIYSGSSPDCNNNAIPDECDIASGVSGDCNGNQVPDECESDCLPFTCFEDMDGDGFGSTVIIPSLNDDCSGPGESPNARDCDDGNPNSFPCNEGQSECCADPPPCIVELIVRGVASRYIEIIPDIDTTGPFALRVTNECTLESGFVVLKYTDYDDGPQGPVNVGIVEPGCSAAAFRTAAEWQGAGGRIVVTGSFISPRTHFSVEAVCGDCTCNFAASAPVTTSQRTWPYGDADGDGQATFFGDLFRMFQNNSAVGAPFWTGPDPGYEVDTQGQSVPDQQINTFTDIFPAFQATTAGGLSRWAGDSCCANITDCGTSEDCVGGLCRPMP